MLLPHYPPLRRCRPVYQDFRPGDVRHSEADIFKAARLLGYQPTHTLARGLAETLDWYRRQVPPVRPPLPVRRRPARARLLVAS